MARDTVFGDAFFFASLLEAIIVIVHIVWLDPAYLSRTFEQTLALVESMSADQNMISKLKQQPIPTPFPTRWE